ncbi:MAG: thiamine-phosphate kinase [Chloroflexota bacterium]|nr:thiamine-phosphate kinase [Chloroflexota bacterium]MDE2941504.1 thiamine-phosphate kinase [Chloroflexota bacterium]MDE3267725.1 thiamine-phosphate kinase [Chloroflexota bacterium]
MIHEIGEFGLIRSIRELVCEQEAQDGDDDFRLLLGIGDDAAAWRTSEATELATTDTLVDGVHFRHDLTSWEDLGWKSMAVNLSDIAAMGGRPLFALVTLGLTRDTSVEDVRDLYLGMLAACRTYGCRIAGGDVVHSPVDFVTVAMTGIAGDRVLTRRAANPGDSVAVTGPLGSAAGGLQALLRGDLPHDESGLHLQAALNRPVPRLDACETLIHCGVKAAMDVSDGLVDDLAKLCEASGVGAVVEAGRVPADAFLRDAYPEGWLQLALNGGEDYELLFTGADAVVEAAVTTLPQATVVGRIVADHPGRVRVVDEVGADVALSRSGWDHFA